MTERMIHRSVGIDADYMKVSELISTLEELREKFGEGSIELETVYEYGDHHPRMNFEYKSPETEVETKQRLEVRAAQKAWKLRQYEALKKELGK